MIKWFAYFFIISTPTWFGACNTIPGTQKLSTAMLELKIELPGKPIPLNQSLPVGVLLVNTGDTAVMVNTRMSVGYEESLSRELYASIKDLETGMPAKYSPGDINRDFAAAHYYRSLLPGDSIAATFNLLEYYPLKKKGTYGLIICYQADEPLAILPAGILKGTICSKPIQFQLLEGQVPTIAQ